MSFGKMTSFIDIVETQTAKDSEGFTVSNDVILASVRAFKEERHGTEKWANMSALSTATAIFKFRVISDLKVTTEMIIICDNERYQITSVEDVRSRGMYIEVLAEKLEGSKK